MKILLFILSITYALLMFAATIKLISVHQHPLVFSCNIIGCLTLLFYVFDYHLLYIGILLLFISALLNGYYILNNITISHVMIRLIFSIFMIYLNNVIH
jgi:hypothetical protein